MTGNYNYTNLPPFVKGKLSLKTWNEDRKNEITELFRSEAYGRIPDLASVSVSHRVADTSEPGVSDNNGHTPGFMNNRAIRKIVVVSVKRKEREYSFPFFLFIPLEAKKKPAPAILTINNRALGDADPSRRILSTFWPAEMMVARGYAAAVINTHDIAPDYAENFTTRFHSLFPEFVSPRLPDAWGAISAWAWGMSRAVDYLVSDPMINGSEIAVAGHSRGGKTSLWCGAKDTRIAMVISSCSGCAGAAIVRGKNGEHVIHGMRVHPFWYCANRAKYIDNEEAMPIDQHLLLGLIAPRPLYISDKTFDTECDPRAEFESLKQASKIYKLYGKCTGLGDMPGPDKGIISGNLGYHIKSGSHNMDEYDWERYLNFCDRHFHPLQV